MSRGVSLAVRVLAPVAAALALAAILTGDAAIHEELRAIAPEAAPAGASIPVRGLFYAGLLRPEGPRLEIADVSASLRSAAGEELSRTRLREGHAFTLEGELHVPATARGTSSLALELAGSTLAVELPLRVTERGAVPPAREPEPRPLRALQQLALEPTRRLVETAPPPAALELRVAGGACVPELPCELLVYTGEPAIAVSIVDNDSVTLDRETSRESAATTSASGVAVLHVVTHGPEASFELRVARDGTSIAARDVRLPIALGADAMQLGLPPRAEALPAAPLRLGPRLLGDDPAGIVDLFHEGRWARTASALASSTAEPREPLVLDVPGLWRVQARRDPFGSQSAAVRSVYVRAPEQSPAAALAALATRVLREHPGDALARSLASGTQWEDPLAARYLLAAFDTGVFELPPSSSSLPASLERHAQTRARVRRLALFVLALAATSLVLLVARRGLLGSAAADHVARESGELPALRTRARLERTLRVLGVVISLLLAFAAIALYLVVRGNAP